MNFLIALGVNLAGMLLIYSLLAFALARFRWHGRGIIPVLALIMIAGLFWSVPTMLTLSLDAKSADAVSYSLWFGNWLVSGFSVVILCQAVKGIPRQLEDSARLDGCGWFGIYWHVVLPLVRRELGLIAFLTAMATSLPFWFLLPTEKSGGFVPLWLGLLRATGDIGQGAFVGRMMVGSVIATLPVIVIFLFAKHYLQRATAFGGTSVVPSTRQPTAR